MPPASRRPPRARPLADAPVDALVAGAEDVTRDWLVEVVAAAPLARTASLPLEALARIGPELVAAVAAALASDDALARLQPGGDLRATAAAARGLDAAGTLACAEALRRAVWEAALAEAPRAPAAMVAELADRLALVCSEVAGAALAAEPPPDRLASLAAREHGAAPTPEPAATEPWAPGDADGPRVVAGAGIAPPIIRPPIPEPEPGEPAPPRVADGDPRTHLAARAADYLNDGRPFAILLVELNGLEALTAAGDDAIEAIEAAERALEDLVRPGDAIRREGPGRLWLTLPGAGPAGARALALRAAAAVERAAGHRGAPLTASVGLAVCPPDGTDPDELAEVAETGLFAARAAGARGEEPPVP